MFDKRYDAEELASVYKSVYENNLDPVGQEDDDVDNDGKKNTKSDKYLKNRRKVVGKAIAKEEVELDEADSLAAMAARREKRLVAQRKKMGKTAGGNDFGHDYGATAEVRKKRQDADWEAAMGRKPSSKKEEKKTTKEEVEVVDEGMKKARENVGADTCWDGYKAKGTKKKNGKEVPNCVKEEEIPEGMNAIRADAGPPKKTMRMSASGQEPAGDKLLRKASQGFSNFMNKLNPKAMQSKPAGPQRKPLVSTPKEEVEVTGEVVEEGKKELSREKRNKMFRRAGNLSRDALAGGEKGSEAHKKSAKIVKALNKDANENDRNDVKEETLEEKKGLWANIHAKRERGESPAEKGDKDYPKTLKIESTDHLTEAAPAIVGVLAKMAAKKAAVHVAKKGVGKVQDKMGKLIKGDEEEEEG
ncbi:MAG: hypothetical protein CML44_00790 [Rhodobacteraceae bacterium]|nr:hypothetical protein [Paracoccaceae bacterium]